MHSCFYVNFSGNLKHSLKTKPKHLGVRPVIDEGGNESSLTDLLSLATQIINRNLRSTEGVAFDRTPGDALG